MIASPNYVRFVYDGDGSDTPDAGPNGSATIEDVFAKYFNGKGLPFEATAFDGRSDYGPFIDAGIPAGGLFTGAEELKTPEEAVIYGGTAGVALDHCYHQACDNYDNNNEAVFDEMSDATADAVLQFAMTTSAVKGTSKANDQAIKSVDADSLMYRGSRLQR
jgi:Zn-dependent M28 family amino/carboxypeptidase